MVSDEPKITIDTSSDDWWHPSENQYLIHDNGGRPFLVRIESPTHVTVYQESDDGEEGDSETATYSRIHSFDHLRRIFIPDDDDEEPQYRGNNILLETSNTNEYILISCSISKFQTKSEIVSFSSNMGNNNVPYPIAVDDDGRFYILWDDVVLESIPDNRQRDPTRYWVDKHRTQDGMRIGRGDSLWYFCMNIDPNDDEPEWRRHQRRNGGREADNLRSENIRRVLRERRQNEGGESRQDHAGPSICIFDAEAEDRERCVSIEEYMTVSDMFPEVDQDPMSYPAEEVFVKNKVTREWDLIDFEKYQQLQNEWRARLQCSQLISTTLTRRRW